VIALIISPGFAIFLLSYYYGTQTYNLENIYDIDKDSGDLSIKEGIIGSTGKGVGMFINLAVGPIYDSIGRKIPVAFFYLCTSAGLAIIPIGWGSETQTPFKGYLIGWILLQTNIAISSIPFVPDLIQEKS